MSKIFSQRNSHLAEVNTIQLNELNLATRIDFYNAYHQFIHEDVMENKFDELDHDDPYIEFYRYLWADFLKRRLDVFPKSQDEVRDAIRDLIMDGNWYRTFDLFEYIFAVLTSKGNKQLFDVKNFRNSVNVQLQNNNVGYRLGEKEFVAITNELELQEVEALNARAISVKLKSVEVHLANAIRLMSLKPVPDLRNSIKESISMVGAVARLIEPSNDLNRSLSALETKGLISEKLSKKLKSIYNYTSDGNGIRHELMDDPKLTFAEARYFLITCSAFTNYLIDVGVNNNLLIEV
jgi:hypothetical protein